MKQTFAITVVVAAFLLIYSILVTSALIRSNPTNNSQINNAAVIAAQSYTHGMARKIAQYALGPDWRGLTVGEAILTWNKLHPNCSIDDETNINDAGHCVFNEIMARVE